MQKSQNTQNGYGIVTNASSGVVMTGLPALAGVVNGLDSGD